ncbi:hypothetical protein SKAU_G00382590 [Synaphobranchus kaupii]|uniref:Uncharacterized protein n=1 Tax=Synaphobranchus kaupii TaxID=118154 RepID=A0A9Q1EE03_SYNKA|nr:hypothetical protein SKAU_G00382590 [Synaphobranchus kaupii]
MHAQHCGLIFQGSTYLKLRSTAPIRELSALLAHGPAVSAHLSRFTRLFGVQDGHRLRRNPAVVFSFASRVKLPCLAPVPAAVWPLTREEGPAWGRSSASAGGSVTLAQGTLAGSQLGFMDTASPRQSVKPERQVVPSPRLVLRASRAAAFRLASFWGGNGEKELAVHTPIVASLIQTSASVSRAPCVLTSAFRRRFSLRPKPTRSPPAVRPLERCAVSHTRTAESAEAIPLRQDD